MIALYVMGEVLDRPVVATAVGSNVWQVLDWNAFLEHAAQAECAVIACGDLLLDECEASVRAFRSVHPMLPLVIYTGADPLALREIADLIVEEVVFVSEGVTALEKAARRASRRWIPELSAMIKAARGIDRRLKRLLRAALETPMPYGSLKNLCAAVQISPWTADRQWRDHWDGNPPMRLEDLIGWILLLRAHGAKRPVNRWKGVAGELGTNPRRLRALSKRFGLGTLRELESMSGRELLARFDRAVCADLVGESLLARLDRSA